jgi:hypothetical protein
VGHKELWTDEQEEHDYQTAEDYLNFTYTPEAAHEIAGRMRSAPIVYHYAANVLRVAGLPALGESNIHVVKVLDNFHKGRSLSPVLLVRGTAGSRLTFTIADGYYRICASNYIDEDIKIPCRMVGKEAPKAPDEPEPAKPIPVAAPTAGTEKQTGARADATRRRAAGPPPAAPTEGTKKSTVIRKTSVDGRHIAGD